MDAKNPQRIVYDSAAGQRAAARESAAVRATLAREPSAGPSRSAANRQDGVAEELEKVVELHARGVLTDAEFAAAKAKLLGV